MSGLTIQQRERDGCLEACPNARTVWLDGLPLNLHAIARSQSLNFAHLSRIMSGSGSASLEVYKKIIKALSPIRKLTLDQLLEAIDDRKESLLAAKK